MIDSLSIVYVLNKSFNKNHYVPPHSHTCFELIFYCSAPAEVTYNKINKKAKEVFDFSAFIENPTKVLLHQNSFLIIPPNVAHDERHLDNNSVMCIGFTYGSKNDFLSIEYKEIPDDKIGIRLMLEQICDEFAKRKYGFEQYMNNLLQNIILTLFRNTKQELEKGDELKYIKQYIKQNIGRNLTISSLADMSGYSVSHFRRVFKEYTGLSPKRYIADLKIQTANNLLINTSIPLSQVAESVGFSDYFQFATFYKKECGMSPGRKRNIGNQNN